MTPKVDVVHVSKALFFYKKSETCFNIFFFSMSACLLFFYPYSFRSDHGTRKFHPSGKATFSLLSTPFLVFRSNALVIRHALRFPFFIFYAFVPRGMAVFILTHSVFALQRIPQLTLPFLSPIEQFALQGRCLQDRCRLLN